MNRFAMHRNVTHEIGVFLVLWIYANEQTTATPNQFLRLRSHQGDCIAFLARRDDLSAEIPGRYQRIFALVSTLQFACRRYALIEEFIVLPDIG